MLSSMGPTCVALCALPLPSPPVPRCRLRAQARAPGGPRGTEKEDGAESLAGEVPRRDVRLSWALRCGQGGWGGRPGEETVVMAGSEG